MTPARWERIEQLYHAADALPLDQRAQFLADACADDQELHREVTSLLGERMSAGGFLSQPAIVRAARMLSDVPVTMAGRSVGRYALQALIGAGGMGEVYHSHDPALGRDVAVKILPPAFTNDSDRVARLEREARMLAALNHPNICGIYGIEEADGIRLLLLELVTGETLADRLANTAAASGVARLTIVEALAIARQLADALEAAHEKGIIHRDLKPANIKITPDGVVKILDFGLAKSIANGSALDITHVPARDDVDGAVIGTAAYMSPEQARGSRVDSRTDIWAFGCVLYEMLTGRLAFGAATFSDTIARILEREPDWSALPAETPAEIRRVLLRCLAKDPKKRLRDIGDVRLEIDAVDEAAPAFRQPTPASPRAPSRTSWILYMLVAGVAASFAIMEWRRPAAQSTPLNAAEFNWTRLTNWEGNEGAAAISPDGKFAAFISDAAGELDVWLTQIGTGDPRNITENVKSLGPPTLLRTLGFTADGEIWFTPPSPGGSAGQKILVPIPGGPGRPLLGENAVSPMWSWDGKHLAYFENSEGDPIFVADGAAADPITIALQPSDWPHQHNPVWSFDDQWIYFVRGFVYGINETDEMDIWRIRSTGGKPERMTVTNTAISYLAPLDARTLLYVARSENREGPWLWSLDTVTRERRRISAGLERYSSVAASRDGRRVVATLDNTTTLLWSVPIDRPSDQRDVSRYPVKASNALAPRFGGDAVFYIASNSGGDGDGLFRVQDGVAAEIWKGSDGTLSEAPAISRDGRRVALVTRREGKQHLSIMLADGTGRSALAPAIDTKGSPDWSPDGKWIVTGGSDRDGPGLFKIPADGGNPVRLLSKEASDPVWSPDGQLIVYGGRVIAGQVPLLAMRPNGDPVILPTLVAHPGLYRFMPDLSSQRLVYFSRTPRRAFWTLNVGTGTTTELTTIGSPGGLRSFDITPDGKQLVFARSQQNGDIVLIERRNR